MSQAATKASQQKEHSDRIPLRMHPRVFAALGRDLVTNDVVAVIELVKNSYDAYARNVHLRFSDTSNNDPYLEILDDGCGMTKQVIKDVWCLVATPYKEQHPLVSSGKTQRRVAGEKGLGRLSVARLGERLRMVTKAVGDICWEVSVDWPSLSKGGNLSDSFVICKPYDDDEPFDECGTRIRVYGLSEAWDANKINDLEENLARLISPFSTKSDFKIFLTRPDDMQDEKVEDKQDEKVEIESPLFLSKPKYRISGHVDDSGNIAARYTFSPITKSAPRRKELFLSWSKVYEEAKNRTRFNLCSEKARCGSFEFDIRAWDIASDDTSEIAERFHLNKRQIRKSIRAHKGISVYRDDVLVLPKSENARDWLGLDLRRVSRVGTRMSTNQLVGYVSISADNNPCIEDTSDRERLASRQEVAEFEEILKAIVGLLESERDLDKAKPSREKPMRDLFGKLDAKGLLAEVKELSAEGASATQAIPPIQEFNRSLASTRKTIQERFVYYSRLSTIGTIAHMLVHEIRNRTIAFGGFVEIIKDRFAPFEDSRLRRKYEHADRAVDALERLANTFSPLASRNFRRRKRQSILEEQIKACLSLHRGAIKNQHILCRVPKTATNVAVDPGELDAILLNLITNAIYWMSDVPEDERRLTFEVTTMDDSDRVRLSIRDTGPGIEDDDVEKVFWPGVTRKPNGIGMGLTVASELVVAYNGHMALECDSSIRGACFTFDLPVAQGS